MFLTATVRTDEGESVGVLVLSPKTFSTGKQGFFSQGKITVGDRRYQAQVQMVEIKGQAEPEPEAGKQG